MSSSFSSSHKKSEKMILHTDGACLGNPGPMGLGIVLEDQSGKLIEEHAIPQGVGTNNQAEMTAICRGLERAHALGASLVLVQMDSEWACKILTGEYRLKAELIRPIVVQIRKLESEFQQVTYEWVPREANARADALSKQAAEESVAKASLLGVKRQREKLY